MFKKNLTRIILSAFLIFSMPLSVEAKNIDWLEQADDVVIQGQYTMSNDIVSKVRGTARGRVLSSAELQLSDEGNGVIGVYASTLCHTAVKEIYMVIYLDVWNEDIQDWVMVDNYEYRWNASDNPDQELTAASVSFFLEGLPRGKTYSLRGAHAAKNFSNVMEVMASETDGIVLGGSTY